MSKAVMISIRPEWCEKILSGEKTVEIRKTKPKLEMPFKVYIYCTQGFGRKTLNIPVSKEQIISHYEKTGSMDCINAPIGNEKVIAEFTCDRVIPEFYGHFDTQDQLDVYFPESCLTVQQYNNYCKGKSAYGWHISDLKIYGRPKEIYKFHRHCKNDLWCEECAMHNVHPEYCGNAALQIKKPPQSWCYVEETEVPENER